MVVHSAGNEYCGTFSPRIGKTKFLLVAIDYFTKWIEAELLATIMTKKIQKFVWKSIVCRFGIPHHRNRQ